MEQNNEPRILIYRLSMFYGFFLGLFLILRFILITLAADFFWMNFLSVVLTLSIPFVAYYITLMAQNSIEDNKFNFSQAFSFTFFLFLFASLILTVVQYSFYQFLEPDFISQQFSKTIPQLYKLAEQEPELKTLIDQAAEQGVPTALNMASQTIWIYAVVGILIGLVNGLIFYLKNKIKK